MNIKLEIQRGEILVVCENNSTATIRLWQLENSWGWDNLSFIIRNNKTGSEIHITRQKNMAWTKNGPGYVEILPRHQLKIPLQLAGKSWIADNNLSAIKNTHVSIKVLLTINVSPEAKELHVWTGKSGSAWLDADPPHRWLFPAE